MSPKQNICGNRKLLYCLLLSATIFEFICLCLSSCTKHIVHNDVFRDVEVSISVDYPTTRTMFENESNTVLWLKGDGVGITYSFNGTMVEDNLKLFSSSSKSSSTTLNGKLWDRGGGTYKIYGVNPYTGFSTGNNLTYTLSTIQFPPKNNWDSSCDLMIAKSDENVTLWSISELCPNLEFAHQLGWAELDFTSLATTYTELSEENVISVSISSEQPLAGQINVNLETQSVDFSNCDKTRIIADYQGKDYRFKELKVFFTLIPGEYEYIQIEVNTERHTLRLNRNNLVITKSNVSHIEISYKESDCLETVENVLVPKRHSDGSTYNILMFGHSFGIDYTEYLPDLLVGASIKNVSLYRVENPNEIDPRIPTETDPLFFFQLAPRIAKISRRA